MSEHEQFGEDLALYALGALAGNERAGLEQHLAGCATCRLELEVLRGDGALLAISTVGPKPPARARQRLMEAVAREPRTAMPRYAEARRLPWWGWMGWAATVAVVILAASLWRENAGLKRDFAALRKVMSQQTLELGQARDIVTTLTASDTQHVTLVAAKTPPQPQGKAFYLRNRSTLVFLANNMPPLPAQKAYELWLIPVQGAPIPAGVFKPDARGSATVINPPLPAGAEAKAFAITVENEAGSPVPTSAVLMVGAGE